MPVDPLNKYCAHKFIHWYYKLRKIYGGELLINSAPLITFFKYEALLTNILLKQ